MPWEVLGGLGKWEKSTEKKGVVIILKSEWERVNDPRFIYLHFKSHWKTEYENSKCKIMIPAPGQIGGWEPKIKASSRN